MKPVVLVIGGHDPSGGAGIQADIETLTAGGCYAATVITCITVQDTFNISACHPSPRELVQAQAEAILADMSVAAIKIGLLADAGVTQTVADIVQTVPETPVVLDPVLGAGGGRRLADDKTIQAMRRFLPLVDVLTPNTLEARKLSALEDLQQASNALLKLGARHVLLTGTHETQQPMVINALYARQTTPQFWRWPRLAGQYHGSGCTLASALAAQLAKGVSVEKAAAYAQQYTWNALKQAFSPGQGQMIPNRTLCSSAYERKI